MRKLSYRLYRLLSGLQYWMQRRLTRSGWLLVCGFVLTVGLVMDTEHSAAYQLLGLASCLLVAAICWAPFFRGSFAAARTLPRFATVGQPFSYSVSIQNLGARVLAGLELLEDLEDSRLPYNQYVPHRNRRSARRAQTRPIALPLLPSRGAMQGTGELLPLRRGILRFTGVTLAKTDPLGLFRGFVTLPAAQSLTVLPRRYSLPRLELPGSARYQHGGVALAGSVGESNEFLSLREYRRGDPFRHIHWKSSARAGELIVKDFQDEFFIRHALILDTFAGPEKRDEFEEAISVAASFASALDTQDSLLDLMFVGARAFCFTAGRGVAHSEQMLEVLANVELQGNRNREKVEPPSHATEEFAKLRRLVLQHAAGLSGCVCIFLGWDQERQQLVSDLQKVGLPLLVLVVADAQAATLDPGPLKSNPAALRLLRLGKIEEDLRRIVPC